METSILFYLLKASIAMLLFYAMFKLLFSRDTFLVAKRFYLLFALIISAVIPFIHLRLSSSEKVKIPTAWLSEVVITPRGMAQKPEVPVFDWEQLVLVVIGIGSFIILIRLFVQLFEIYRLKYRNLSHEENGLTLIQLKGTKVSPFSFFKWIFVGESETEDLQTEIILHEQVHAKQWHSVDVMVSELFCILFWWNPVVWLFRREIRINHEFMADRGVLKEGFDAKHYQYLLLETAVVTNRIPINNYFNISQLKNRITMMNKKKSSRQTAVKYLLALPLVGLLVAGNAVVANANSSTMLSELRGSENETQSAIAEENTSNVNLETTKTGDALQPEKSKGENEVAVGYGVQTTATPQKNESKVVTIQVAEVKDGKHAKPFVGVEQMPKFPGGDGALMKYLSENLKYPKESAKNGVQGRVTLRFTVEEDGSLDNIAILKGVDPALDAEAVRMVNAMPKWIPGKQNGVNVPVYYTLPIYFSLDGQKHSTQTSGNSMSKKNLLYVADGKVINSIDNIDPKNIESITVLKDKAQMVAKYGDAAKDKDGVIDITMKK